MVAPGRVVYGPARAGTHKMTSLLGNHRSAALRHRRGTGERSEAVWGEPLQAPQHWGTPTPGVLSGVPPSLEGRAVCWVRALGPPWLWAPNGRDGVAKWGENPLCNRCGCQPGGNGCRQGWGDSIGLGGTRRAGGPGGHSKAGASQKGWGILEGQGTPGVLVGLGCPGGAGGSR